eukprot:gene480-899_t
MNLFTCHREVIPSTGVHTGTFFKVFNKVSKEFDEFLVAGSSSSLNIYKVCSVDGRSHLFHCFSSSLFGKMRDIAATNFIDLYGVHQHQIIASLDDGKIVILRYNSQRGEVETMRMFNSEEGALGRGSEANINVCGKRKSTRLAHFPFLAVDENSTVSCSVLYGMDLFIVPLQSTMQELSGSPICKPFIINLSNMGLPGIILDLIFVKKCKKPTLAILQESRPLPLGHLNRVRNTCSLLVFAIDIILSQIIILWRYDNLPHDSCRLLAINSNQMQSSSYIGIISMNAFLIATQDNIIGIATNGFASTTVSDQIRIQPWPLSIGLELDASRWIDAGNGYVIGSLKDGTLLQIQIYNENIWKLIKFEPQIIAKSIRCSNLSISSSKNLWFMGSRFSDSLLIGVTWKGKSSFSSDNMSNITSTPASTSMSTPASKRQRRVSRCMTPEQESLQQQLLQDPSPSLHCELVVEDMLPVLGPVLDGTFTGADESLGATEGLNWDKTKRSSDIWGTTAAAAYIAEREVKDSLQISVGADHQASLCRVTRGFRLAKIVSRDFSGATSVHSVYIPSRAATLLFLSQYMRTRVLQIVQYQDDVNIMELDPSTSCFVDNSITIAVGYVSDNFIVQIFPSGIRLLGIDKESSVGEQDFFIEEDEDVGGMGGSPGEVIEYVDIGKYWIVILTNFNSVFLIKFDSVSKELIVQYKYKKGMDGVGTDADADGSFNRMLGGGGGGRDVSRISLYFGSIEVDDDSESSDNSTNHHTHQFAKGRHQQEAANNMKTSAEEIFLYGEKLNAVDEEHTDRDGVMNGTGNGDKDKDGDRPIVGTKRAVESSEAIEMETETETEGSKSSEQIIMEANATATATADVTVDTEGKGGSPEKRECMHLMVYTVSGELRVIRLDEELKVVFSISNLSSLSCLLPITTTTSVASPSTTGAGGGQNNDMSSSPNLSSHNNMVTDLKLVRVRTVSSPEALSRLCLIVVMASEDVVVYVGNESNTTTTRSTTSSASSMRLHSFSKLDHGVVTRRRRTAAATSTTAAGRKQSPLVTSADYQTGSLITLVDDLDGRCGALVGGPRPVLVSCDHGLPFLMPIALPELPYIGDTGKFRLGALRCGSVSGVVTLWRDNTDVGRGVRMSSLGLYKDIPGLKVYPGGSVTVRQMHAGCTVHKCKEILPKSDDKIQQSLLRKKTFVLVCSEEIRIDFTKDVLTEAEKAQDRESYDRFYSDLDSFCQPDEKIGQAPKLIQRQYKVVIIQNGEVVDIFQLEKFEVILDIEAVYLNTDVIIDPNIDTKDTSSYDASKDNITKSTKSKKKVFVVVSTTLCDNHGEDTQGEGRLLLLDLDYAIYQNIDSEMSTTTTTTEKDVEMKENSTGEENPNPNIPSKAKSVISSAQTQFLGAIQPKLRLLWKGYGPATVVTQFGEYILSTVGPTVYLYKLNAEQMELEQVAQFYAQFYVVSVSIVKNYIILADAFKSLQFLVWREEDMSLTVVAKDFEDCVCMASSFIMDGPVLALVVCDDESNMRLMRYNPRVLESRKGFQLVCLADMHLGSDVTMLLPHRTLSDPYNSMALSLSTLSSSSDPKLRGGQSATATSTSTAVTASPYGSRLQKTGSNKSSLVVGTMEGSLGLLVPVEERTYRRLALLQQIMSTVVMTTCGLNPREYRIMRTSRIVKGKKRGVLDGNLLFRFIHLDPEMQSELTGAMGTTNEIIKSLRCGVQSRSLTNIGDFKMPNCLTGRL